MSDTDIELEIFGDPDAGQCIDGVCTIPTVEGSANPPSEPDTTPDEVDAAS